MSEPSSTNAAEVAAHAPPTRNDADMARTMYDPTKHYGLALKNAVNRLRDEGDYTEATAAAHVDAMSEAFADAGLSTTEAERLHDIVVLRTIKPADEETSRKEHVESKKYLREKYSEAEATRRLGVIKQYLGAHPELDAALTRSGAGSHPAVIRLLDDRLNQLNTTPHPRALKRAPGKR
jgi:hypothetical protein